MSNYTKSTNFATKDALSTGNALKRVQGAEVDDEFNAISTAIATKANTNNTVLTGVPVAPTASSGTSSTQIATTAFASAAGFPAGTSLVFYQASAPTGWTKVTTHTDKALRVVSGSGGGSGGSTAFSSAFTHGHSDSFSSAAHTLTVAQMPAHTHTTGWGLGGGNGSSQYYAVTHEGAHQATGSTGSNNSHTHGLSGAVTNTTIAPYYVDVIICTKN